MMDFGDLTLFACDSSRSFGESVAAELQVPLSEHEERDFPDGEHASRPLVSVRGRDVFVIQSLYADREQSVNDKLCRLLFFVGALRDASAARLTAVLPYLCYAREDHRVKPRDSVITRYIARLLEAAGVDRVLAMDVHDLTAYHNAFRIPADHLSAASLFARHIAPIVAGHEPVVVSPDAGGIKRVEHFREMLSRVLSSSVGSAFMTKRRTDGVVTDQAVVTGNVEGKAAIILDDMISTGETLKRAVNACRERGAQSVYAAATHGLFAADANRIVAAPTLKQVVVTNTVPPFRLDARMVQEKLVVLDAASLFAEAIRRIHEGGSIEELLNS